MWPFRKKRKAASPIGSFQEWRRAHVRAQAPPISNPLMVETICPLCFEQFPAGSLPSDHPSCSDCASEGMDLGVEPLTDFLAARSAEDLDSMLVRWDAAEGFRTEFKAVKAERIRQLKALKVNGR